MSHNTILPTFLVIGTMKGGTTSLFRYLGAHPEVSVSPYKELEFFSSNENWCRGIEWYAEQFGDVGDARAVGECSTGYTKYPGFTEVPARIASVIPNCRLVYVIRDPVERIRSQFEHAVLAGVERRSAETVVLTDPQYVDISRYAVQIERYLDHFAAEQILVLDSADLRLRRRQTMRRIFGFLGVDAEWWGPEVEVEHYVSARRAALHPSIRRVANMPGIRSLKRLTPVDVRRRLGQRVVSARPRPGTSDAVVLSPVVRQELALRLHDDVEHLRELAVTTLRAPELGRDWLPKT
jgi:Sulfotransferase domain